MSIAEMKWEIVKGIDLLQEKDLENILSVLEKMAKTRTIRYDINSEIDHVLREDEMLLNRLAK